MGRREIIQYYDDLDSTPLSHDDLTIVRFSVNGSDYILEVSPANAEKFHEAIKPFVAVAHREPSVRARRRMGGQAQDKVRAKVVREWAQSQGIPVAPRGKVRQSVFDRYYAAHPGA
ncbi:MAG: Lsr2 family protein [Corynebacterium sp.]|nr:Lsr2 family protein [Corynebacterium sp.]